MQCIMRRLCRKYSRKLRKNKYDCVLDRFFILSSSFNIFSSEYAVHSMHKAFTGSHKIINLQYGLRGISQL